LDYSESHNLMYLPVHPQSIENLHLFF
jgi:hypothetical protein